MPDLKLLDWEGGNVLFEAANAAKDTIKIICPFIKVSVVKRLLKETKAETTQVITRFNMEDFYQGVSDTDALRFLLDKDASIRGVQHLHSKL